MKFCFFNMRSVAIVAIVVIYSATCWSVPVRDVSNNAEATTIFDSRIKVIHVEMPSYPIGSSNSIIRESEQYEQFNTVPYRPIVVYPLGGSGSAQYDANRKLQSHWSLSTEGGENHNNDGNQNSKVNISSIHHRVIPLQFEIANPPPEQLDREWVMVPDETGNFHLVNVELALNTEPVYAFDPEMGVIFELYTRGNPHDAHILRPDDSALLASSNFNPDRPTRFVCHGFNSDGEITESFSRAYFQQGNHDVNFISVNWQAGSNHGYLSARTSVSSVGSYLARMIDFLVLDGRMKLKDVVLIGHSLGAHVVGIAGKHVSSGKLPLIVGLDPASPIFNYTKEESRIAVGDAITVETIHTNGGWLGFSAPLGDASFYPNGGRSQPGCGNDFMGICSHSRAHEYYVESINSKTHFYGYPCESYDEIKQGTCTVIGEPQLMGGESGSREAVRGVFYLETADQAPFALGPLGR